MNITRKISWILLPFSLIHPLFSIIFIIYWAHIINQIRLRRRRVREHQNHCDDEITNYLFSDCDDSAIEETPIDRSNTKLLKMKRQQVSYYLANRAFIKFGRLSNSEANKIVIRRWISMLATTEEDFTRNHTKYGLKSRDLSMIIQDACILYLIDPSSDLPVGFEDHIGLLG